jgi:hypothetical protein
VGDDIRISTYGRRGGEPIPSDMYFTHFLTQFSVFLIFAWVAPITAEVIKPAVGSAERKALMDTLRALPAVEKLAEKAGAGIVFEVKTLLVDGSCAVAEVVPGTKDGKKKFTPLLAFLRRGGDEPWFVPQSGGVGEAWLEPFLAEAGNADFKALWQHRGGSPSAAKIKALKKGDADYDAIEKLLLTLPMVKEVQQELGKPVLLGEVVLKSAGEWAWIVAQPRTADKAWQGEALIYLLQKKGGKWTLAASIPEEVNTADDPDKAYQSWRTGLLKKHPSLAPALVPLQ